MLKCTLDGTNAKTLAKALQSLSKFGTYLFLEGLSNELQFRTVNLSKSAVATIKFSHTFFETYSTSGENSFCKVSMKTCMTVFKNMNLVEQCQIHIIPEEEKILIQFKSFKLETVKDTYISILEEENISAVHITNTKNCIIGSHKLFTELLSNFNTSDEEITFEVKNDNLTVKNYIENTEVYDKFMRTQLRLPATDFENYNIECESTITFALKEFRAFLLFAESINENLILHFYDSGSPLYVNIKKMNEVDCLLTMSTLSYEDITISENCQETNGIDEFHSFSTAAPKRKLQNNKNSTNKSKVPRNIAADSTQSIGSEIFAFNSANTNTEISNDISEIEIPRNGAAVEVTNKCQSRLVLTNSNSTIVSKVQQQAESAITFQSTNDVDIDIAVPQSPTREQQWHEVRSIFSRCFQSTYIPDKPTPGGDLYVENSDTED